MSEYKPKHSVFYPVDEFLNEVEFKELNNFCEDCFESVEKELRQINENYELILESSPEKMDFCLCENCGEIIEVSNLFTSQEVEHWLSLSNIELKNTLNSNRGKYELQEILRVGLHDPTESDNKLLRKLDTKVKLLQTV